MVCYWKSYVNGNCDFFQFALLWFITRFCNFSDHNLSKVGTRINFNFLFLKINARFSPQKLICNFNFVINYCGTGTEPHKITKIIIIKRFVRAINSSSYSYWKQEQRGDRSTCMCEKRYIADEADSIGVISLLAAGMLALLLKWGVVVCSWRVVTLRFEILAEKQDDK